MTAHGEGAGDAGLPVDGLQRVLDGLAPPHRAALAWFQRHRDEEVTWPQPLPDGTQLLSTYRGIQVPQGWRHALSVRQMLAGPYADDGPDVLPDGSWRYRYFQDDPAKRNSARTNGALVACRDDRVPVGVVRQSRVGPPSRYKVLGLALVRRWGRDGYFQLDGLAPDGSSPAISPAAEAGGSEPVGPEDARRRVEASIVVRQGQGAFRAALLADYGGRCAITGCDVAEALDAAHIEPYRGPHTNTPSNGILLRGDLHTLFDLHLVTVAPDSLAVRVSGRLEGTHYTALDGQRLQETAVEAARRCGEAFAAHQAEARMKGHLP